MTSQKQIEANRRNAAMSTGPKTDEGKQRSRQNAYRHGLTAETVISAFESAEDYARFEEMITGDFDPQTAVECQLVLRVAALLWRLRRALAIETGLFDIQGKMLRARRRRKRQTRSDPLAVLKSLLVQPQSALPLQVSTIFEHAAAARASTTDPSVCFLGVAELNDVFERIGRYETRLWRQLAQTLLVLNYIHRRGRSSEATFRDGMQLRMDGINCGPMSNSHRKEL